MPCRVVAVAWLMSPALPRLLITVKGRARPLTFMRNEPLPLKLTLPVKPPALGAMPMFTVLLPASMSRLALPVAVSTALMLMSFTAESVTCPALQLMGPLIARLSAALPLPVMVRVGVVNTVTWSAFEMRVAATVLVVPSAEGMFDSRILPCADGPKVMVVVCVPAVALLAIVRPATTPAGRVAFSTLAPRLVKAPVPL